MTDTEKIQILLKEYETLRSEILQRSNQRFTFLAIAGALGTATFFTATPLTIIQKIVLVIAATIALAIWMILGLCLSKCAERVSEIEETINKIANFPLLEWETKTKSRLF